jgi:hypothetical protein
MNRVMPLSLNGKFQKRCYSLSQKKPKPKLRKITFQPPHNVGEEGAEEPILHHEHHEELPNHIENDPNDFEVTGTKNQNVRNLTVKQD